MSQHAQLLVQIWVLQTFHLGCPLTVILSISASQEARITGISQQSLAWINISGHPFQSSLLDPPLLPHFQNLLMHQGSALSPFLYLYSIPRWVQCLGYELDLYSDDSKICTTAPDLHTYLQIIYPTDPLLGKAWQFYLQYKLQSWWLYCHF
jgi:hypothetical protein